MNVAYSKEMATQAWQPPPVQPTAPGQSSMSVPQGQWQSSTTVTQSQGMPSPLYNGASNLPASPTNAVPPFRAPNQANSDSSNSQSQQPATPPAAASLPQGSSIPPSANALGQGISGYVPQAPSFAGPRWPPPPSAHTPQTGPPASVSQTGPPTPIPQTGLLPLIPQPTGLPPSQRLPGPPGLSLPSGLPWHPQRPSSSGPHGVSGPPAPPGIPAPHDSSGGKAPPLPPGAPSASATSASTQAGNSGLAVPSVALGPALPAPSAPPGLAPLSVSQVPVNVSGQPSTPGPPGLAGNINAAMVSSMPNVSLSESSGSSAPPGVASAVPAGISSSASLHVSSAVSAVTAVGLTPPGPPGVSVPSHPSSALSGQRPSADTSGPRPSTMASTSPASTGVLGAGIASTTPVAQQPQYVPYISVPPVPPPLSPWGQVQPRAFPPFVNVPNPYLPPIRPAAPIQAGNTIGRVMSDSAAPLAPLGEQVPTSNSSTAEGDRVSSVPSLSGQVVNGQATTSASVMMSITSSIVTESALGSEASARIVEVADVWTAHKTSEGIIYYYNSVTGQSTYEKPPGFQGEVDKVTAQPTPVSWEMIGGTGWALVITNDAKRYYYHRETQATSWQVPAEVAEHRRRQIDEASLKLSTGGQPAKVNSDKGTVSFSLTAPGTGSLTHKAAAATLDLIKKKLQDSSMPGLVASDNAGSADGNSTRGPATDGAKEKTKDNQTARSSSESSSDSDDEEQGPTKEECISQFKEMLKEKGIVPFSKWEKELPKIIFDPRFKAIPSHTERRSIFDHYVRTRAEEERKEKRAAQKAAIEGFKQLLEEASKDINHSMDYEKFAKTWGADPRFEALERKDRETLLNERVLPLRKAEEERIHAIQSAAAAGFKAMLIELGDINSSSRWSRVKDSLRNDSRYRTVRREDREALFNAYVAELRAAEQEAERAAKAKREEEERRREREREKRKRKERDEQEWEKARAKALKREATTAYQALLMEKIKDPEASWTESRPKLEKDALGRATNPELDSTEREKLFREHVKALYERALREYRALLADALATDAAAKQNEDGKSMLNSWSEAKKQLKSDPRYGKMPREDREGWWRRYAEDIQRKMRAGSNSAKEERHSGAEGVRATALEGSKRSSSRR
eukprot:c22819_g1_i1 orf=261-3680(+)